MVQHPAQSRTRWSARTTTTIKYG